MEDPRIPGAIVAVLGMAAVLVGLFVEFGAAVTTVVVGLGAVLVLLGAVMAFRASGTKEE